MWEEADMKYKLLEVLMVLILFVCFAGCAGNTDRTKKLNDLDFTVLSEETIPGELKVILEEKKQEPYKLTFEDNDFLYICIGYGEQKSGGYSIAVQELYETQNAVYVHTNLLGPTEEEAKKQAPSWPHIVVKTQKKDKTVVFD